MTLKTSGLEFKRFSNDEKAVTWILESARKPTRADGPMANETKVQVEVLTPSGKVERRNFFVASEQGGFDDFDIRPVKAWRPLPAGTQAEPYRHLRRWY
ncbi:hypothetical protein WJ96_05470 [Burkholderia ubonensis]|uniref:DUF551 domain-containing protein n=1 Tax=Burkholderia ubonensis TaxID=101571 RepID=A0AAW3MW58_9BURK|nr:hypothetical protein [Burkholderia ubonensis]KVP75207.1 hypothetical protein WJ93_07265 [Burkholderia ubonensis]KVP96677.1 hypothetical protein WJ97_12400 [Burkholderia ubonensis]KVP98020.1 hypothetical protein WJ96_05470 [Burkholderia ubonensis]KVZ92717.1 hypothetical protein WL25_17130 [Burkholderia ubonensis]